jgi:hypothetical protein
MPFDKILTLEETTGIMGVVFPLHIGAAERLVISDSDFTHKSSEARVGSDAVGRGFERTVFSEDRMYACQALGSG